MEAAANPMAAVEATSRAEAAAEAAGNRPPHEPPRNRRPAEMMSTADTIFDERQQDDQVRSKIRSDY